MANKSSAALKNNAPEVADETTITTTIVTNQEGDVLEKTVQHPTGNVLETPPAKAEIKVGVVIRGNAAAIPEALLNRGKTTYNWADMAVGDHKLVPKAEAATARASAYAFARSKGRKFATQAHSADKNYVEVWRLMDPTPAQQDQSENEDETTE